MKLKNVLIVVDDMERAKAFYRELFGLSVILDGEERVILTEGLVLQEKRVWEEAVGGKVTARSLGGELYFEEPDLEGFVGRLEGYREPVEFVNRLREDFQGQKMIRFYDLDGNLIEVRSPVGVF
ncbi:MAG: glyoxalase [Hungatella sp.]|nr:glyoxalase [Hungatella sp.]